MLNDVIIDLKMIINKQQIQCTEKPRHICQAPSFDSITNHQYFQSLFIVGLYETFFYLSCVLRTSFRHVDKQTPQTEYTNLKRELVENCLCYADQHIMKKKITANIFHIAQIYHLLFQILCHTVLLHKDRKV